MKRILIGLAVIIASQAANASYSDNFMAQTEGLSPFDRAYEAGRSQKMNEPADYRKTESVPAAVLDLSIDDPVISVQETETERRYRDTLAELEKERKALDAARAEAKQKLENATAAAIDNANQRVGSLVIQQAEIEMQRKKIEDQLASIRAQQQEIDSALEKNSKAIADVELIKTEQLADISQIHQESEQILMLAESSAEAIESAAQKRVTLERVDPTVVLNEPVTAEYQGATIKEIVTGIMPVGWRVKTDFTVKPELENRRYEFVSTDARDLALRKLTSSIRDVKVSFAYFWDLTDEQGNPSPMIVITDNKL